jgi:hypothetical protein
MRVRTPVTLRPSRVVTVLPVGDFGFTVARHVRERTPNVNVLEAPLHESIELLLHDPSAIAILIAWRPTVAVAEALDRRSHATGTPFLSLTLNDTAMLMGPIVIPGMSSCWRCWASREMQADVFPGISQCKLDYYAAHPSEGPSGYLHSLALLGAAQLCSALENINTSAATPGEVIRTDLFARRIEPSRAIGFDNCDRCGLKRPIKSRSLGDLRHALRALWPTV